MQPDTQRVEIPDWIVRLIGRLTIEREMAGLEAQAAQANGEAPVPAEVAD